MKSKDVGLIVRTVSFQDFQPTWSWSTNITDRRTDDMQLQDSALCYSASCSKNSTARYAETHGISSITIAKSWHRLTNSNSSGVQW